ncbi:MAG: hypothetical protein KDA17_06665 [Candidatus Saccharibacteria bacterium]|nr:hypothetical protein [Candidatus Saccharibacteria bacterium]
MEILQGLAYVFKGRDFAARLLSSFFKLLPIGIPLFGYQVRISMEVSRGNEDGLPPGGFLSDIGLGIALFIVQLPVIYVLQLMFNAVVPLINTPTNDPGTLIMQQVASFAFAYALSIIPSYIVYLRWIQTENIFAVFNVKATIETIQGHLPLVIWGYVQYVVVLALYPIILVVGGILTVQFVLAICGVILLLPVPFLVQAYVIGKVGQKIGVRALDAEGGEIYGTLEDEF